MRIMFVRTGSSCRGPMAELCFNELGRRANRPDITVCSAEILAWGNASIARQAAAVMQDRGTRSALLPGRRGDPNGQERE